MLSQRHLHSLAGNRLLMMKDVWKPVYRRVYSTSTLGKTTELHNKTNLTVARERPSQATHVTYSHDTHITTDLNKPKSTNSILQVPGSTYGGLFTLQWKQQPRNVLIIKKPNDVNTENALIETACWLHQHYPDVNIIVEPQVAEQFSEKLPFVYVISKDQKEEYTRTVDFAITLGGDGTILHLSSLFPKAVPPVICFSLGTLGFLMAFQFSQYQQILRDVIHGKASVTLRMRLFCSLHEQNGKRISVDGKEVDDRQVMNEVALHRGRYSHLTSIECYVDEQFLTECVADGLIVATPTGSTAYSLSAGGPIVHPTVQSIVLTPICPRSLSFRTVLLPSSSTIKMRIGESSKSQVEVSIDGQEVFMLGKGEYAQVRMSKYPIPCVSRTGGGNDWAEDINELLKWNQNFGRNHL